VTLWRASHPLSSVTTTEHAIHKPLGPASSSRRLSPPIIAYERTIHHSTAFLGEKFG